MTFYFENDVNVATKSKKLKKLEKQIICSFHGERQWRKQENSDSDPLVRGTDP